MPGPASVFICIAATDRAHQHTDFIQHVLWLQLPCRLIYGKHDSDRILMHHKSHVYYQCQLETVLHALAPACFCPA